ncbi:hypothetical protein [Staphylococcus edaphicus]|uniref:DUF1798 domain-containing protein n=1 Tax=Staphylococcus edaphicus TaxID=1955013 RepID=A0A2C6WR49_9STAP|nr:hypothetical protein [Staphylococcus edaphicus]PHK50274.1 hypothetical protein BTJ66_04175 [Staphylococcus edaphicus]UQW82129.1 hypothetical protein MNY58_03220 [Staphylococcus edaphicus]
MYQLEFHNLEQRMSKLLNLIEVYKFAYVTNHKKKSQYKMEVHKFIEQEYNSFKQDALYQASLFHYNYFTFLSNQIEDPLDELTIGNTSKHIDLIQQRLLHIHQLLSYYL